MKYIWLIGILILAGCNNQQDDKPAQDKVNNWQDKYVLNCNENAREAAIKNCITLYYKINPGENPELEDDAFRVCRQVANRQNCKWKKP